MRPQIWFVTYDGLPDLDPDDALTAAVLDKRGYKCVPKIWDDPKVEWDKAEFVVVRSTWDYHRKFDQFFTWLSMPALVGKTWNSPELMKWNCRKTYLRELENAGIEIVPTVFIDRGTTSGELTKLLTSASWKEAVLKPVVGLSTFGVSKLDLTDPHPATEKALELVRDHDAMLQPYMNEIEHSGERSLMFMRGKFSHAIRKIPFQHFAPAGGAGERFIEPEPDELKLAERVLANIAQPTLYARVDVVRDSGGTPRLMELELIEPSLFLQFGPGAPERFADAIEATIAAKV